MPAALERLVEQLLESKDFYPEKSSDERRELAYAIANKQKNEGHLQAEEEFEDLTFEFEQVNNSPIQIKVEATENGDLLRFRNAILAQAETNKNNDHISPANIDELAATLSGRAVDISHDELSNAGIITAARKVMFEGNPAVAIDGLGWRDRYPVEWDGVRAGTHHLSVEADADKAVCSICKGEFTTSKDYCDHLKNRRLTGAKRGFIGLRGKGAGITTNPAGTKTRFDRDQIFVVAHQEPELEASWYDSLLPAGESLDDLPASDFADPKGRRFPYKIHGKVNERGWKAAWSAAHGGHTGEKDTSAIAKLKRDKPAGVDVTESQEDISMDKCPRCNADVTADATVCPSCHKDMQATAIAADLKASEAALEQKNTELTEALASLESLEELQKKADEATANKEKVEADLQASAAELAKANSELETAKTNLQTAQDQLAQIKATQREAEIKPLLSAEAWEERKPAFLAMDDDTFTTMAASLKDVAKRPTGSQIGIKSGMPEPVAGSDNGKKISLR